MGKYLKMSDYFVTGTFSADYGDIHSVIKYKPSAEWLTSRLAHYAVEHAINSHDELVAMNEELLEALEAAVECGMVPTSSAMEGGAMKYVRQAHVADQIRSAIAKAKAAS